MALQDCNAANTIRREYTWGLNLGGGICGLLNLRKSGLDYVYLYDGKGNVEAILYGSQNVMAAYRYDPFGKLLAKTGALDQPFRFSTKRGDAQTGLAYYGYRFYSPEMGRWATRDPLGEAGGINLDAFVGNVIDARGETLGNVDNESIKMKQEGYRKNNPNCEETHVTFRVIGNTVDPGKITQRFGIEPSFSYMKGEQFRSYSGILKRPTGIWAVTSEAHIQSTSLEQHFNYLLDYLKPASLHIQKLIHEPNIEVDFLCYWLSSTGHGGPVLSSPMLRRISALCDTLNFDYYGPYEEDDNL